jgi:hypothetical protein
MDAVPARAEMYAHVPCQIHREWKRTPGLAVHSAFSTTQTIQDKGVAQMERLQNLEYIQFMGKIHRTL